MASNTTTLSSILVIGPTGSVGKAICRALITQKTEFTRIAFFRDLSRPTTPTKAAILASFRADGMEEVSGLYTSSEPFQGFDCVVMPLGNHAIKHQPTIIDSAITAGVRHFYPSEFGADLTVGQNWTQRYYRDKVLTREHLVKRGADTDTPDLGWTFVQIGRFTEWSVIKHFGIDNKNRKADIYGAPSGRQSLLSVADSIAFILKTLQDPIPALGADPAGTKGRRRTYRFHGSSPTWGDIFTILSRVNPGPRADPYAVTYHHVESALEKEARAKQTGDVDLELEASHQLIQGREGTLLPEPWDNERFLDIRPEGVEEALAAAFRDAGMRAFLGVA